MALDIVFLAVAPIDRDPKSFVFKFAIDPFLDLVRKLIGRGRCRRNRGRSGNSGSSRCRERGRRSRRFRRSGRCLCVDGQHQAKNSGTAKNKCFHSFHLLMRCREKRVRIQKNEAGDLHFGGACAVMPQIWDATARVPPRGKPPGKRPVMSNATRTFGITG